MKITVDKNTTIVFDLDDTLCNEIDYLKSAYLEIAKNLEPVSPLLLYSKMVGWYRTNQDVFSFLISAYTVTLKELLEAYRNHAPETLPLRDGVTKIFKAIKAKGGKIAVITDGRSITQRNKLKALGLIDALDCLVISSEIGTEKPNRANFDAVEEKLKTHKNWYIADNVKKDFISPNAMGWEGICIIDNGLHIHKQESVDIDVEENMPKHMVLSLSNIVIE